MENLQGGTLTLEHRYVIEQLHGRHALETLYRGTHEAFLRPIWIQVYDGLAEASADPRLAQRIKASALEVSKLGGEGMLRVIDYGEIDEGLPFVISERIAGPSLREHLQEEGALGVEDVDRLLGRLAQLLERSYQQDIRHGNLSSSWVFLPNQQPEEAWLGHFEMGFSLQELRSLEGIMLSVEALSALPPEAFAQQEDDEETWVATERGDVYALGVLAYECLARTHPFFGSDADPSEGILRMRQGKYASLDELGFEAAISEVIDRALAAAPEARYRSPRALSEAFHRAVDPPEAASTRAAPAEEDTRAENELAGGKGDEIRHVRVPALGSAALSVEPSRLGNLTAAAIALLVLSNLAWFFVLVGSQPGQDAQEPGESTPASERSQDESGDAAKQGAAGGSEGEEKGAGLLPQRGVQLRTQPEHAKVMLQDSGKQLGQTPMHLNASAGEDGVLKLRLVREGFREARIEMREQDSSQDVIIHLEEEK